MINGSWCEGEERKVKAFWSVGFCLFGSELSHDPVASISSWSSNSLFQNRHLCCRSLLSTSTLRQLVGMPILLIDV